MRQRELREHALAVRRDPQSDFASIAFAAVALQEPARNTARRELDRAVMFELQSLREHADRGPIGERQGLEREQKLMLLRLDAGGPRSRRAEGQEAADLVANLGERDVIALTQGPARRWHRRSIS